MCKQMTTDAFIKKAKLKHGDRYDYTLTEYKGYYTKIKIICNIHGEFEQRQDSHLNGFGCSKCSNELKKTNLNYFIEKAKLKHGDKYTYNKVVYVQSKYKIIITCSEHGDFFQQPNNHLLGRGCAKCSFDDKRLSNQILIEQFNRIHNNKYNYSRVKYKSDKIKIKILCPEHGEFE